MKYMKGMKKFIIYIHGEISNQGKERLNVYLNDDCDKILLGGDHGNHLIM